MDLLRCNAAIEHTVTCVDILQKCKQKHLRNDWKTGFKQRGLCHTFATLSSECLMYKHPAVDRILWNCSIPPKQKSVSFTLTSNGSPGSPIYFPLIHGFHHFYDSNGTVPGAHAETTAGYLVRSSCARGWILGTRETGGCCIIVVPTKGNNIIRYLWMYMMYKWHIYIYVCIYDVHIVYINVNTWSTHGIYKNNLPTLTGLASSNDLESSWFLASI